MSSMARICKLKLGLLVAAFHLEIGVNWLNLGAFMQNTGSNVVSHPFDNLVSLSIHDPFLSVDS
jgi:hypothetical protein